MQRTEVGLPASSDNLPTCSHHMLTWVGAPGLCQHYEGARQRGGGGGGGGGGGREGGRERGRKRGGRERGKGRGREMERERERDSTEYELMLAMPLHVRLYISVSEHILPQALLGFAKLMVAKKHCAFKRFT